MVAINREAAAVYLLDDDASILKATRRLLDSAGWNNVEIFTNPVAFLEHAVLTLLLARAWFKSKEDTSA